MRKLRARIRVTGADGIIGQEMTADMDISCHLIEPELR
jgi:hypothetical protein